MLEMLSLEAIKSWVMDRVKERTSWDGFVIIGLCLAILFATPLIKMAAWAGIGYGIWTIIKEERAKRLEEKTK